MSQKGHTDIRYSSYFIPGWGTQNVARWGPSFPFLYYQKRYMAFGFPPFALLIMTYQVKRQNASNRPKKSRIHFRDGSLDTLTLILHEVTLQGRIISGSPRTICLLLEQHTMWTSVKSPCLALLCHPEFRIPGQIYGAFFSALFFPVMPSFIMASSCVRLQLLRSYRWNLFAWLLRVFIINTPMPRLVWVTQ